MIWKQTDPGEGGGERGGGGWAAEQGSTSKQKDLDFAPAEMPAGLDVSDLASGCLNHALLSG